MMARGHRCQFRLATEGQVDLLQHESVHVAVDGRDRVSSQWDRKSAFAEYRIPASSSPRVAGPGLVLDAIRLTAQGWRSRTARVWCARWLTAFRQSADCFGRLDLGGDEVDQPVEDLVLAIDVVVQRGGFDPQLARQPAHGDGLDPLPVRHDQGYPEVRSRFTGALFVASADLRPTVVPPLLAVRLNLWRSHHRQSNSVRLQS